MCVVWCARVRVCGETDVFCGARTGSGCRTGVVRASRRCRVARGCFCVRGQKEGGKQVDREEEESPMEVVRVGLVGGEGKKHTVL